MGNTGAKQLITELHRTTCIECQRDMHAVIVYFDKCGYV